MFLEDIRNYCLQKKGVEEDLPFGPETLVYKVMGKLFLLTSIDHNGPLQFNVKCLPEKALALRADFPCVIPGYHMNKKHWNTIICDGFVADKIIYGWIDDSYNLIINSLTKKLKTELDNL